MHVYFFGCWNQAGHYLWLPGGGWASRAEREIFAAGGGLDGTLAPRRMRRDRRQPPA